MGSVGLCGGCGSRWLASLCYSSEDASAASASGCASASAAAVAAMDTPQLGEADLCGQTPGSERFLNLLFRIY